MRYRLPVWMLVVAATMACSSQRKISQVETRQLASVISEVHLSPLREKVSRLDRFAKACPPQLIDTLPSLATEKVRVPACPESLSAGFLVAKEVLRMDERTNVEELLGSGCRVLARDFSTGPLVPLLEGVPPANAGRREAEEEPPLENEMALRNKLSEGLRQVRTVHEPLEQWMRLHGDFVMSEEELDFFDRLVAVQQCLMGDQEVDESYRALHNLEDLARIQPATEPQRQKLERLLSGVHALIDRKIGEYFRK